MELVVRYDDPGVADDPHHVRFATITPGAPGRCPGCDTFGFIDLWDPRRGLQTQHCRRCGSTWEFWFRPDGSILEARCRVAEQAPPTLVDLRDGVVDLRTDAGEAAGAPA